MSSSLRKWMITVTVDFLLVAITFFFARYFVKLPRWYYLLGAALIWVIIGIFTAKLSFASFRRIRYAITAIIGIDALTTLLLFHIFIQLFPDSQIGWNYSPLPVVLTLLEICYYFVFRRLVMRKITFHYEEPVPPPSAEKGYQNATKYDPATSPEDLTTLRNGIVGMQVGDAMKWVKGNGDKFCDSTVLFDTYDPKDLYRLSITKPDLIVFVTPFTSIRHLNTLLANANMILPAGGFIAGHCTTSGLRREKLRESLPRSLSGIYIGFDYLIHRVIPKTPLLKNIYFLITRGRHRQFTRVEILGRISMAGFEIAEDDVRDGEFYITARKVSCPLAVKPNTGILIRLKRIGKNGKIIGVYKFRTMHVYSEYLQSYIYTHNSLQDGGKMAHDYRITTIGRFLRKTWLDELPMILNWIAGDLKLVGVRPLSTQYFSLYTPALQNLRTLTKPGLIPPFYAEKTTPVTLEEVQANEMRYLTQYMSRPISTDWKYFWKAMGNIVVKGRRSK